MDRERIEREARSLTSYVDGWCPPNVRDVLAERIASALRREAARYGPQRWGEADGRVLQIVSEWDMDDLAQVDDIESHVRDSLADLPAQVAAAYRQFISQRNGGQNK